MLTFVSPSFPGSWRINQPFNKRHISDLKLFNLSAGSHTTADTREWAAGSPPRQNENEKQSLQLTTMALQGELRANLDDAAVPVLGSLG